MEKTGQMPIFKEDLETKVSNDSEGRDWEKIARVALGRFPELQRKESVGIKEIRERFEEIKEAGYEILKPYSGLKREEAWKYLMQVRAIVRKEVEKYFPEVLEKIDRYNHIQKDRARTDLR